MPTIQYSEAKNAVQMSPTMSNVQPNNTVARGFSNVQRILQGGLQLKAVIDEKAYSKRVKEQQSFVEGFDVEFQKAPYERKQVMLERLSSSVAEPWSKGKDEYSQDLYARGYAALSRYSKAVNIEGQEIEHNNNLLSDSKAFADVTSDFNNAPTNAEKLDIVNKFRENFVAPLVDIDDPKIQAQLEINQQRFQKLTGAYQENERAVSDNKVMGNIIESIQYSVQETGTLSKRQRDVLIADASRLSSFETRKSEILNEIDNLVVTSMLGTHLDPNLEKSFEMASRLTKDLEEYAKISPNVIGKDYFRVALNNASSVHKQALAQEQSNVRSMLQDDSVSLIQFSDRLVADREHNVYTPEEESALLDAKKKVWGERDIKQTIAQMVAEGNFYGLQGFNLEGRGSQIATIAKAHLNTWFSNSVETRGVEGALADVLEYNKQLESNGIRIGSLEVVDHFLNMPLTDSFINPEDVTSFLNVFQLANESGYFIDKKVTKAWPTLKVLQNMGVSNIAGKWQDAKLSSKRPSDQEITSAVMYIIDNDDTFSENLASENRVSLRNTLWEPIKLMLQIGVDPKELARDWEGVIDATYIRADLAWGGSSEVLIPKTSGVSTEDAYTDLFDTLNTALQEEEVALDPTSKAKLLELVPLDPLKPEGDWVAWMGTGKSGDSIEPYRFSYKFIADVAKTNSVEGALSLQAE